MYLFDIYIYSAGNEKENMVNFGLVQNLMHF